MQTRRVWIWKTVSTNMGRAVEHFSSWQVLRWPQAWICCAWTLSGYESTFHQWSIAQIGLPATSSTEGFVALKLFTLWIPPLCVQTPLRWSLHYYSVKSKSGDWYWTVYLGGCLQIFIASEAAVTARPRHTCILLVILNTCKAAWENAAPSSLCKVLQEISRDRYHNGSFLKRFSWPQVQTVNVKYAQTGCLPVVALHKHKV